MEIKGMKRLRRYVASLSLVTLITSMFVANVGRAATFPDVQPGDWYYTYVEQLASGGLIDTKQKKYRPGDFANRAEAAKMLVDAAGLTLESSAGPSFKDAKKDAWYYKYVETAVKNGIVGGYKDAAGKATGMFGPGDNVTREQFAKMAYNALALKKSTDGGPHFSDVAADRWSYDFVETLYNWSVIDGYQDGTFGPARNINRAEIAKMVVGAMNPVKRAAAFKLSSAASKSLTSVALTFSGDVDATSGAVAANYSVKESGGTATLAVSAAAVSGSVVTLTTASQTEGKKYTVTVSGVKSKAGKALDAAASSADFTVAVMTFSVKSAMAKSATTVEIMFSMDVDPTSVADSNNYEVKDAAGVVLADSAAVLATGKTDTVWLTTAAQTVDKDYTLTVKNVKSKDGKVLDAAGTTAKFKGFNPITVMVKSATSVEVTFSDDVDTTSGAVVANYTVAPVLAISAAAVNGKVVTLTTASQTAGTAYVLTVKGVMSKVTAPAVAKALDGSASFTGFSATPVTTGGTLTVASAAETPAAKTIATKTANNTLLVLDLTSVGETQVSAVQVMKTGLYADSSVKVVAFDATNTRISSGVTFSDGLASVTFYTPLKVSGSTSTKVWLNVSITGTANGNLGIRVKDAVAVTSNASKVNGSFPIDSVVNTVVDGTPSVASITIDSVVISPTTRNVDIGEADYEIAKYRVAETSSKEDVKIRSLTIFNNGSAADGDVKNFKLVDQSGNTLATVADQKSKLVKFDLSKSPYVLGKGATRNFSVKGTIANGATRTAQLLVQNDFDLDVVGVTTGAAVLPTAVTGGTDDTFPIGDVTTTHNNISINEGTLTVSKANTSPSGDVTVGATDVVLGSFELKAAGEDIELQRLKIALASTDNTAVSSQNPTGTFECASSSECDLTGSVKVQIDEKQDGTSVRTVLSVSAAPATVADLWGAAASLANQDLSSFYTIPAGKSVNLLITASLGTTANTATGESITVGIRDVYHYKKSSLKYGTQPNPSATVRANAMTVNRSSLTVTRSTALGNQTIVAQSKVKLGSFVLTSGSAESIDITSINLTGCATTGVGSVTCAGTPTATGYSNLYLARNSNSAQLGTTKGTVTLDNSTSNTYSFSSLPLAAGTSETIDVYGDVSSSATANIVLSVAASGVSGTGKTSSTTVSGPAAALALQPVNVVASGNLTVSVANQTPVSQELVAGSTNKQVLMLQLTASNAEDIYIKKMSFRAVRTAADISGVTAVDPAIKQGTLLFGTDLAALTKVGATLPYQSEAVSATSNGGLVEFNFSGSLRPKIVKNGTAYAAFAIDLTPSNEATVSGKTPQFFLADLQAEGLTTLTASGASLTNNSGIILQAGGSSTYGVASSPATIPAVTPNATLTTATSGTLTITSGPTFSPGDVIFVDQDAGTDWDPATEELMVVLAQPTGTTLNVQRGAFGTTAQTTYGNASGTRNIYTLNFGAGSNTLATNSNGLIGNQFNVYNTKPTFAVASTSPTGTAAGATNMEILRFNATADANTAPGLWKVQLTQIDLTVAKSGLTVANLKLYPAQYDLNETFRTPASGTNCLALSQIKWRCVFNTQSGTNEVLAGATNTYVVRADVGSGASGTTNTLQTSIASLGSLGQSTIDARVAATVTAGDVTWSDVTTTGITWTYQPISEVKPSNPLSMGASSGTTDATAPTVSSITITKAAAAANALVAGDTIVVLFSEALDPSSIKSGLVPGGVVTSIATIDSFDVSFNDPSGAGNDFVRIRNVADITTGVDTLVTTDNTAIAVAGGSLQIALNSAGTQVTISLPTGVSITGNGADTGGTKAIVAGTSGTVIKDINNNVTAATAANSATLTFPDI